MEHVIIRNTRSASTIVYLVITLLFTVGVIASSIYNWPPRFSFEWILFPTLFVLSISLSLGYLLWIMRPKEARMVISDHVITIFDPPRICWIERNIRADEIIRFVFQIDDRRCWFETKNREIHRLSDHLAIEHKAIAQALKASHPNIAYDAR